MECDRAFVTPRSLKALRNNVRAEEFDECRFKKYNLFINEIYRFKKYKRAITDLRNINELYSCFLSMA